jgi:tetratricopeptide (TPR) repeat protein
MKTKTGTRNYVRRETSGNVIAFDKARKQHAIAIPQQKKAETKQDWLIEGNALAEEESFRSALRCYKHALELDPNYFDALLSAGAVSLELNHHNKAIQYYKRALKIDPSSADVHHGLGMAYMQTGRMKKAKESLLKTLELSPNTHAAIYELGYACEEIGEYSNAILCYRMYLKHVRDGERAEQAREGITDCRSRLRAQSTLYAVPSKVASLADLSAVSPK